MAAILNATEATIAAPPNVLKAAAVSLPCGNLNSTALLVTAVLAILCWRHFVRIGDNKPGPRHWPILGSLPGILYNVDRLYDWSTEMLLKAPTMTFRSMAVGLNEIITANPANLEHILKTRFEDYPKGPEYQESFRELLGHGMFNSDDEIWRRQRKTASLEFSARSLRELMVSSIRKNVYGRLLPTLKHAMKQDNPIDLQDVLLRFTFDSICQIGFGVDVGCLAPDLPEVSFAKAYDTATSATLKRQVVPQYVWSIRRFFQLGSERDLKEALKVIDAFATKVICQRREVLKGPTPRGPKDRSSTGKRQTEQPVSEHSDILSRFMLLEQEDGGKLYTDTFLRDVTTNFILAGRDTSSVALSWFFWLLTKHPEVEQKIYDEISSILEARSRQSTQTNAVSANLEGKAAAGAPEVAPQSALKTLEDETFSFEELKSMNYLHAAISEALRLYPSVPADTKFAMKDDILPDGTVVTKGWRVTYMIYSMGRMPAIWGQDCCEFRPERWLKKGEFQTESTFKYPAFNAGPRLCLGKDMAYLQMKSISAAIIRNFRLVLVPGHVVAYRISLTLFMKYGLLVKVLPR
eukprot:SM000089S23847  [mRNA]  locus=s89:289424:292536:- [translate_table: standard]